MNWYYLSNEEKQGPVSEGELMKILCVSPDAANLMISKEGLTDWTPARTFFPEAALSRSLPSLLYDSSSNEVVCRECGIVFSAHDMVTFRENVFCESCQPVVSQNLKEGGAIGTEIIKGGTWREDELVLTSDGACMPGRCVKCNVATEEKVKRKLFWHHPAYYLLIGAGLLVYVIVALMVRKKATIEVGFCQLHRRRRTQDIYLGWAGLLAGIAMMIGGFLNEIPMLGIAGVIFTVSSTVYLIIRGNIVTPKRIDVEGRVWLTGVSREYLESLPSLNG